MASRLRLDTLSRYLPLACIVLVCFAVAHAAPQSKSFQSENEIMESMPKLASYQPHSDLENSSSEADSASRRAWYNKIMSYLEQRNKMPTNWIIHQALMSGQHKRQIRYQQCYFNPISCF